MNETLKALIELQAHDTQIIAKRKFIDSVPLRINEVDSPLKAAEQELQKISQKSEGLQKKKKEREGRIEEINESIRKMRGRTADIKTNKEFEAYKKEIENFEAEIRRMEDEILVLMEEIDNFQGDVSARKKKVADEHAKLDAIRRELETEVSRLEGELGQLKQERTAIVARIEPDVYRRYLTLLERGHGTAVTATRGEICMGCDMNIPPQLFVEIRKNEEIIECPQCHRILYSPSE